MNFNRKKLLLMTTLSTLVIGITLATIPFFKSLNPSAKAKASLPRIDISGLKEGEHLVEKLLFPADWSGYEWHLIIYRMNRDTYRAWKVPMKNGLIGMPDLHWWRPYFDCKDFGPTMHNGLVNEEEPIRCHDSNLPSEWWEKRWQWNIEGKALNNNISDMPSAKGVFEGKYFVYGKHR